MKFGVLYYIYIGGAVSYTQQPAGYLIQYPAWPDNRYPASFQMHYPA